MGILGLPGILFIKMGIQFNKFIDYQHVSVKKYLEKSSTGAYNSTKWGTKGSKKDIDRGSARDRHSGFELLDILVGHFLWKGRVVLVLFGSIAAAFNI
jgi:hypothetical protein